MKKDLKQLRQSLAEKKQRGLMATNELNVLLAKDTLTNDEQAKMTALDAEVTALEGEVAKVAGEIEAEEKKSRRASVFAPGVTAPGYGAAARTVGETNPETTGGFKSMAEFAVSVRNAIVNRNVDERLAAPSNYEQNQGAAGEGYLVPADYRQDIWSLVFNGTDLIGLFAPQPTSSNAVAMASDETTPWGATGVQAYWRAEASQMTASKIALGQKLVQLHELYAFCIATDEILSDAPRLQNLLTVQASRAIRWQSSEALMWGDGNGKPLGFMNANALVTVSKESGQTADSIQVANVLKMSGRVLRTGGRPVWIANSDVEEQLAGLTIGNIPAFLPNNQPLSDSVYEGSIRGKPLLYTEHAATLGDLGDIALIDPSGYFAVNKAGGGIDFAASIHLYFDYGMQAFRWTYRLGGQPYLSAPVSPAKGANTKSHFVTLQARA